MKFEKKVAGALRKCYSVTQLICDGEPCLAVAAEKQDPCYLFTPEGNYLETLWENPGGVMSMVQPEGYDNALFATEKFYSPNDSTEAGIVYCRRNEGEWIRNRLVRLPFVHRFDILRREGHQYLIACTIKSAHAYKDDWRSPGKVYAAELTLAPEHYSETNPLPLHVIGEGLTKNHGYFRESESSAIISAEEGVFRFTAPESPEQPWLVEQLLDLPASDAATLQFGDGTEAMVVLSPFHGDMLSVYEKKNGRYILAMEFPEKYPFLHAICTATLCGEPVFLIGNRGGNQGLYALRRIMDSYKLDLIDQGSGPANVYAYRYNGVDMICAANRETDEIAIYRVME